MPHFSAAKARMLNVGKGTAPFTSWVSVMMLGQGELNEKEAVSLA